jgi:hypothetical protein
MKRGCAWWYLLAAAAVCGLAMLAAMRQLQDLTLQLTDSRKNSLQDADMRLVLSAVRHVRCVVIEVQQKHVKGVQDVVRAAEKVLTEQGLQPAAEAVVKAIGED